MDIKEAYDVIYEHLKEECYKQVACDKCLYGTVCGSLPVLSYEKLGEFRKVYLKHRYDVDNKVDLDKKLVDNPYCNRVYANKGDKVLCINNGGSYTTYDNFFKENYHEDLLSNYKHAALTPGIVYTVVAIHLHSDGSCNVYILENDGGDIFLCTDDTDYLYKLQPDAKCWTEKSKDRLRKIQDNNSVFGFSFHCVPGGHLFVQSLLTSESLFMSDATRKSSKAIQGTLNKFIKDNILI